MVNRAPLRRLPSRSHRALPAGAALLLLALGVPRSASAAMLRVAVDPGAPRPASRLAKGKFVVASRDLHDPNFAEAVILLVDYDERGALGVIVNRPTEVRLTEALPEVKELRQRKDTVFLGGPVGRDRMVVLLRAAQAPPQSVLVFEQVYATGSLDALRGSVKRNDGVRAYAGYTGWGPRQLDAEVERGDWLIGPADSKAIFEERPNRVWEKLLERLAGDWAAADVVERAARNAAH